MESYPIACSQLARVEQVVCSRSKGRPEGIVLSVPEYKFDSLPEERTVTSATRTLTGSQSCPPHLKMEGKPSVRPRWRALRSCTNSNAPLCAALYSVLQNISDTNSLVFKQIRDKILSALCLCLRRREELADTSADAP